MVILVASRYEVPLCIVESAMSASIKCGTDLAKYKRSSFQTVQCATENLILEKSSTNSRQTKVAKYLKSTRAEFQNEEELIQKCARLFNQNYVARQIWLMTKRV